MTETPVEKMKRTTFHGMVVCKIHTDKVLRYFTLMTPSDSGVAIEVGTCPECLDILSKAAGLAAMMAVKAGLRRIPPPEFGGASK